MVVFSRNTVELIKLDACYGVMPVRRASSGNGSCEKQQHQQHKQIRLNDYIHGWQYIVTRIIGRQQDLIECYKIVLNYMLRFVKADATYKYNIMFNIIPAIIKHTNGDYYIILRMRLNQKATITMHDVIARVITGFNPLYTDTLCMETETERRNIGFLHWLYIKEYMPYAKKLHGSTTHTRSNSSDNLAAMDIDSREKNQSNSLPCQPSNGIAFYATSSLDTSDQHVPPLPKTFDIYRITQEQLCAYTSLVAPYSMGNTAPAPAYGQVYPGCSSVNDSLLQYLQDIYGRL